MIVRKAYCDRCKKEIPGEPVRVPKYVFVPRGNGCQPNDRWVMQSSCEDYCKECAQKRAERVMGIFGRKGLPDELLNVMELWIQRYWNDLIPEVIGKEEDE